MNDPKPNGPLDLARRVSNDPLAMTPPGSRPPRAVMPLSDDAELEIRRSITRHHHQLGQIAELTTDRDAYRQRADLAEAEITVLVKKLQDSEHEQQRLRDIINTLKNNFDNSADLLLKGIKVLNEFEPRQVQAIEAPAHDTTR